MPTLHATPANIVFILSSAIGLWCSLNILPRYVRTYRDAVRLRDEKNRRFATGVHSEILAAESIRGTIHLFALAAGVWSLFLAPPPLFFHDRNHLWANLFILWAIVFAQVGTTLNTLVVRRGYLRRRGESPVKLLPSRDTMARLVMRVRRLERRVVIEEKRNDTIEETATVAFERANTAEARADDAHTRADLAEDGLADHEERLETAEDVLEIKRTATTKTPPMKEGKE